MQGGDGLDLDELVAYGARLVNCGTLTNSITPRIVARTALDCFG